jgi:uncharacterized protein YjdB
MRAFILAVTGLALVIVACSSGGTSVVQVENPHVAVVTVALPSPSLMAGQTGRATATALDENGAPLANRPISWSSSAASIATIDATGMIAAVAPGAATITATSEGKSGSQSLAVTAAPPAAVASVSVSPASPSVQTGGTVQLTATTRDADNNVLTGRAVAWASSSTSVATVSSAGLVSAVAAGTSTITATSEGQSGTATVTVTSTPPAPVASVTVSLAASSRSPGQTTQATATTRDANNNILTGRAIAWSSSNTSVATVSTSGLVTAVAAGTAQITATSEGQSGSATFTVTAPPPVPVASVTVTLASGSGNPGQTTQATATTRDANNNVLTGRVVTWSSSNNAVATVSTSGLVTAVAAGTAQITATSEGQSGSATYTVNTPAPAPVASVSVSVASSSLIPGQTTQATATTRDANNNVLTGRAISWSSSNNGIATVSTSGLVTAVAVGTGIQITATSEGVSGSATISVQAAPPPPTGSNEPAGMTVITERSFSALGEGGWYDQNSPNLTIVSDPAAPKSPPGIEQMRFPAGFGGGGSAAVVEKGLGSRYSTIYVSYWMKMSSNWYGHPTSNVNKQMHLWINGGNHVFTLAEGSGTGPLHAEIWLQGTAAGERNLYPNLGNPGTLVRGQWHRWEIVLTCNTNGAANGTIEWWIDGVKIGQYYDVRLEPSLSNWEIIQWSPTWGGTGSTVPADQFESVDHIYISGKN